MFFHWNSLLYNYVEKYKEYLTSLGVNIKEARIPYNISEISSSLTDLIDYKATSFWFGSASTITQEYLDTYINKSGWNLMHYSTSTTMGVRPVIVI